MGHIPIKHHTLQGLPAPPLWKQDWSYCRFQLGDKQRKQAVWAQPLDLELWAGAALQGQAEQRRKERLTEAHKSTPDDEAATRRALHQGGCWAGGQGCSGRWMKKRCYGIYHGIHIYIYIYHSIYHDIYQWYKPWYVLHISWYIAYNVWYIPHIIYLGIYHPYIPCHL